VTTKFLKIWLLFYFLFLIFYFLLACLLARLLSEGWEKIRNKKQDIK